MDKEQAVKTQAIQDKITDSMMGLFESVKQNKDEEYKNKKTISNTPADVEKMIAKCGNNNAAVSGGVGLLPGPWVKLR